jgi:hypothetical protein
MRRSESAATGEARQLTAEGKCATLRPPNVFWFTFQEEYRELLRKHGLDFDERYVWD